MWKINALKRKKRICNLNHILAMMESLHSIPAVHWPSPTFNELIAFHDENYTRILAYIGHCIRGHIQEDKGH